MPIAPKEIDKADTYRDEVKEVERDLVRRLSNALRLWDLCEHRICRRMRQCLKTQTCQTRYAGAIERWKREWYIPQLRKRFPTVQWGAPASIVHAQLEAALAAEAEREARGEGQPAPPKRRRKRVPRRRPYMPRDFIDGQA